MTNTAWPLNAVTGAPSYTGKMVRQSVSALLAGATSTRQLGARSGVRIGTPTTTVTATSTVWTVNPHSGVLDVQTSSIAGPYLYAIDTAVTGAVTAADSTYPRVDIVYVQLSDNAEDGSGLAQVVPLYLAGTPALSPSAPATPPRSMVLANLNVPIAGGGSPSVVWNAPYSAAAGAILPVRNATERAAAPAGTAQAPVYTDQADTQIIYRDGGSGPVEIAGRRARARVTRSSVQTLTSGAVTAVAFDALDTHGSPSSMWSSGAPTQIVIPWDGWYSVTANVAFDVNATGFRLAYIAAGATRLAEELVAANTASAAPTTLSMTTIAWLPSGTAVTLMVDQTSGGSLNVITSEVLPTLTVASA